MHIGLDAIPLTEPKTGVGHYTFELAHALAEVEPSFNLELAYPSTYPALDVKAESLPLPSNLQTVRVPIGNPGQHWWLIGLPLYARRRRFDIFHGTNYEVPLLTRCPTVLTIHDLSLFLYPATHEARRVRRARRRLPLMARRATMIITPTESVRREVCAHFRIDPAKVVAVPEAPRRFFRPLSPDEITAARKRLHLEEDFLLAVGTIEPRKNLHTLVRAFEEIAHGRQQQTSARKPLRLVIAGKSGWLNDQFFADVARSTISERIHFTGYVSDEDLRAYYSCCEAFIYPSVYEGFGLPPLEAMACGAPVIAGRIPALCETLGETAARLFAPTDVQALVNAISELISNRELRLQLSIAGQSHAAKFTWERAAQLTRDVYEEAIKRRTNIR